MATYTVKITSYSSVVLTYAVTQTDTQTIVKFSSGTFRNTRSTGTTAKVKLDIGLGIYLQSSQSGGYMRNYGISIPKGTKSKTFGITHTITEDKVRSASTKYVCIDADMESSDDEWWSGDKYLSIAVPAKTNYAVTYSANGGAGAPASQVKWYNEALTLQSDRPSRENHSFLGWGTGAGAAEAAYQPSASYTANAALALYAVWRQVYASPGLSITRSYRCDSAGAPSDDGAWAAVELAWNTFDAGSLTALTATVNGVTVGLDGMVDVETAEDGKSGTAKAVIDAGMAVELTYAVTAAVEDAGCSAEGVEGSSNAASRSDAITRAYYTMQFRAGGVGAAIGLPASSEDFNIGLPVNLIRTALVRGEHIDLWPGGINLCDKAGEALGFMQPHQRADGRDGLQIGTGRNIGGTDVWNTLALTIDEEGTPNVEFGFPGSWLDGLARYLDYRTAIANVIAANSSVATISGVECAVWGRLVSLHVWWTNKSAISVPAGGNITNVMPGTLVGGIRPRHRVAGHSDGDNAGAQWYDIQANGQVWLGACEGTGSSRSIAANSRFDVYATYIRAT